MIEPELLDHADPEEARVNLADLVRINHRFGGYSTAAKLLSRVVQPEDRFTLLDVGAASGDMGRHIASLYPNAKITSLDYNLVNAQAASSPKLIADAFALPFRFQTFDFVFSSLFLHHFTDEQVKTLLYGFYSTARQAVLIIDLERHVVPYCFLPATRPFFKWNDITVHDGVKSVRAAFTRAELEKLAKSAGIGRVRVEVHRPAFRLSLVGSGSGVCSLLRMLCSVLRDELKTSSRGSGNESGGPFGVRADKRRDLVSGFEAEESPANSRAAG